MCFALPFQISEIKDGFAYDQKGKRVKLSLVSECRVGDFLLVQADVAVEKVSGKRAMELARSLSSSRS